MVFRCLEITLLFLTSLVPKVSFSPTPDSDFSFSLGLNLADNNDPAEVLNLPERIAEKTGIIEKY